MWFGKCFHGLGAIGVEVLAVLLLGWLLSVVHPSNEIVLATRAQLTGQSVTADSLDPAAHLEKQADRQTFVVDHLENSAEGLLEKISSHLNDLFDVGNES